MCIRLGIDQLSVDADLVARATDASFQHIADTKLAADLLRLDRFIPVGERGIPRDHEHVRDPRQIGRQILGDPVREILLLPVFTQISEGHHHNG